MKDIITKLATGVNINGSGNQTGANQTDNLANDISGIINAVIGVLGLVCVVVMIVGGVNYMTSAGDTGKVKTAKNTILYGLIGLIICVLAFAIVNWLINTILSQ